MALVICISLIAAVLAWIALGPWLARRRRLRLRARPFPESWRRILRRRVPLYARMPPELQRRLRGHMQVFLHEKRFVGCGGLSVTEEMRVIVAAQACLLLLNRPDDYFPELRQILLYPDAFITDRAHGDAWGLVHEARRVLSGESSSSGQVVLSWRDALGGAADPADGRNVVLHEFAHQLDQEFGYANGAPLLASREAYQRWAQVMGHEYRELQQQLSRGEATLLNPYGATDPAEFFAVATEAFFEQAQALALRHWQLYQQLQQFYGVDPRQWA